MNYELLEAELRDALKEFDAGRKRLPGGACCISNARQDAKCEAYNHAAKRIRLALHRAAIATAEPENTEPEDEWQQDEIEVAENRRYEQSL